MPNIIAHSQPQMHYKGMHYIIFPGVGRRCWPQFYQRKDLHPGHRTLSDLEGAVRPQWQGDDTVLCWGSLRAERSWKTRWKSGHLEGGREGMTVWKWNNKSLTKQQWSCEVTSTDCLHCELQFVIRIALTREYEGQMKTDIWMISIKTKVLHVMEKLQKVCLV